MGHYLADIVEWLTTLPVLWAYVLILVIAYGENVLPPIPGDMIVVFGGYMVGLGKLEWIPVIFLSTLGGTLGFMTMFGIGHRLGTAVLDPKRFEWLPKKRIYTVREKLRQYGFGLVTANRFLSGLRSVISLTVGMAHMDVRKTILFATISSFLWTSLLTVAGYFVGDNWEIVSGYLRTYGGIIVGLMITLAIVQWVRYRRSIRIERQTPEKSVPGEI